MLKLWCVPGRRQLGQDDHGVEMTLAETVHAYAANGECVWLACGGFV